MRLAVYQPDIPQNLGGIIRIGACFGVPVDVISPTGFPFSVKALRRAAMDYADLAEICHHDDWSAFQRAFPAQRLVLLSTKGRTSIYDHRFASDDILLLGRESAGVPADVHSAADCALYIPMPGGGRSMNVTVCAGIAMAEALRQRGRFTSR